MVGQGGKVWAPPEIPPPEMVIILGGTYFDDIFFWGGCHYFRRYFVKIIGRGGPYFSTLVKVAKKKNNSQNSQKNADSEVSLQHCTKIPFFKIQILFCKRCRHTSGPMPAGSPIVTAIFGRLISGSVAKWDQSSSSSTFPIGQEVHLLCPYV